MIFFPEIKTFSGNNIYSSFHKCPLGKVYNLNDIFHARKGQFAPGKKGTWQNLGGWPPLPPRFLRP